MGMISAQCSKNITKVANGSKFAHLDETFCQKFSLQNFRIRKTPERNKCAVCQIIFACN